MWINTFLVCKFRSKSIWKMTHKQYFTQIRAKYLHEAKSCNADSWWRRCSLPLWTKTDCILLQCHKLTYVIAVFLWKKCHRVRQLAAWHIELKQNKNWRCDEKILAGHWMRMKGRKREHNDSSSSWIQKQWMHSRILFDRITHVRNH